MVDRHFTEQKTYKTELQCAMVYEGVTVKRATAQAPGNRRKVYALSFLLCILTKIISLR